MGAGATGHDLHFRKALRVDDIPRDVRSDTDARGRGTAARSRTDRLAVQGARCGIRCGLRGRRCAETRASTARPSATLSTATSTTPMSAITAAASAPSPRASLATPCAARPTTSTTRKSCDGCAKRGTAARPKSACRAASIPATPARPISEFCDAVKRAESRMHVHAFSPLEVRHGAASLGLGVGDYLDRLIEAGLGSLPGTAAEILDDGVRAVLCPDKLTTQQWLDTVEAAHRRGLRTTATIMFGHIDTARTLGTPPAAHPRPAGANRRVHRIRAACRSCTWRRRST